jgi:acyl-CoA reductase-like NAD-dependent aldehyde dehydrogenase
MSAPFTSSHSLNGLQIALAAAENLTPVTLELGGKDPAIILPDTDLQRWSSIWMRGILYVSLQYLYCS